MFLLDTNVISELRKTRTGNANANVVAWARGVPDARLFLPAVVVHELELGVLRLERRDTLQGAILRAWLEGHVLPIFADRILPLDAAVARRSAALHAPDPKPYRDAFIAATALVHGMTLVTRNISDFRGTGVSLINPWDVQAE